CPPRAPGPARRRHRPPARRARPGDARAGVPGAAVHPERGTAGARDHPARRGAAAGAPRRPRVDATARRQPAAGGQVSGSSVRLEWRYAAAGLGWGVAVGGATGGLLALGTVVSLLVEADGPGGMVGWAGVFLAVPLYGLLLGAVLGGVAGTPGGLANA